MGFLGFFTLFVLTFRAFFRSGCSAVSRLISRILITLAGSGTCCTACALVLLAAVPLTICPAALSLLAGVTLAAPGLLAAVTLALTILRLLTAIALAAVALTSLCLLTTIALAALRLCRLPCASGLRPPVLR